MTTTTTSSFTKQTLSGWLATNMPCIGELDVEQLEFIWQVFNSANRGQFGELAYKGQDRTLTLAICSVMLASLFGRKVLYISAIKHDEKVFKFLTVRLTKKCDVFKKLIKTACYSALNAGGSISRPNVLLLDAAHLMLPEFILEIKRIPDPQADGSEPMILTTGRC
jgi:hypothetical protein